MPQQTMPEEEMTSPYPANYVEEVAQSLGIKNGKVDVFEICPWDDRNTLMLTLSGSLGGEGAVLKLKWKP
jgi:hypothetical protein